MLMTRQVRRALIAAASLAAATGSLAACGSSDSGSSGSTAGTSGTASATAAAAPSGASKQVRIAFMPLTQANPYIQATLRGIEKTAAKNGGKVEQVFDSGFDAAKQFSQCQDAIASGRFDAFIVVPVDSSVAACMQDAIDKGIKVANTDFPLGPDPKSSEPQLQGQTATVVDPPDLRGQWIFELVQKACAGADPCKFALLTGAFADPYSQAVINVVKQKVKENPALQLVAVKEGGYLPDPSLKATQDILQGTPDLNVVATTSDPMTEGAEKAVEAAGKTGQVKLIGGGAGQASYTAIPDGRWVGTFLSLPEDEGAIAADLVIRAARGEEIHKGVSAVQESGLPAVLTKDNFADVQAKLPKAQW